MPSLPLPTTFVLGLFGVVLSLVAWGFFLAACRRIYRFIAAGEPLPGRTDHPWRRAATLLREVFGHTTMFNRPLVAVAHWFVMVGFLLGVAFWFEAYIQAFAPAGGWPWVHSWPVYALAEEIIALGTIAGIVTLIVVRLRFGGRDRLSRFFGSNMLAARAIEAIVLAEGVGMLLVKAGQIATFRPAIWWADPVSGALAGLLPASPVLVSCFALFKLLVGMAFLVLVARHLDWGVAWHRFLAFFSIYLQRNADGSPALGGLAPMRSGGRTLTLESVTDEDHVGVGKLEDASWKLRLDAASCTECGRCQDLCPAWNTDKPLSPKRLMTSLRDAALTAYEGVDVLKLAGEVIDDDVLWSCTNCGACVDQCPVDIEHVDHIADLRRFRVLADSEFPSELTSMFKAIESKGNPWGRAQAERASWVEEARRDGIDVPVFGEDVTDFTDTEYLFWVGCSGAFDDEGRKTTRAVVELLHTAGVKFAVLAKGETCTGDPARRAGNEFLFQMLAAENIGTLDAVFDGVPAPQRKIVTTCPHCFNTLRNEYPDFDGHYDVFHHTQLLNRLVRDKRLTPVPRTAANRRPITYHDPCFLGRHNQVFDPPRELLGVTGMELREMDRNRNEAFCCGAGGARMFQEEKLGTRINEFRTQQALATGAEAIAVGCPFCNTMMTGGVKALTEPQARPEVLDVARMLRDATLIDGHLPAPQPKKFLELPIRSVRPAAKRAEEPREAATTPAAPAAPVKVPTVPPAAPPAVPPAAPAIPVPGAVAPPAPAIPVPGAATPPAPAVPAIPVPGAVAPPAPPAPPAIPVPGAAVPPAAPAIPVPGAATPPAPAVPAIPVPGAAVPPKAPVPPAIPVPGAAVPPAAPAIPVPGAATPPAPAIPVPGAATPPKPPARPSIPVPGAVIPPAAPPIPAPGAATPPAPPAPPAIPVPGAAVPPAAPAVPVPGASVPPAAPPIPVPGAARPATTTPAAPAVPVPGAAVPPAAPAIPAPGAASPARPPKPPKPQTPPAPPVPPAPPGSAIPPAPSN